MWTFFAIVAAFCTVGAFADVDPKRIGCFLESTLDINGFHQKFPLGLTPLRCSSLCFGKGFKHSATINGSTCKCGDLTDISSSGGNGECNSPCSGDASEQCGGPTSYTLYTTGLKEIGEDDVEDYEVGCVTDGGDERLIQLHKQDLTLTNTPKKCIEYCKALGFWHAGVQYTFECYCGEAARLSPLVPGCDLPCVGDEDQICGGNWKINVYRTGVSTPPKMIKMKGCYAFSKRKVIEETTMELLEPNKCVSHCFERGYKLAFLHNGRNCMCSNVADSSSKKGKPGNCDSKCPGNKNEVCGSATHSNMYTTGIVGEPSMGKLIGCYLDTQGSIMKGPLTDLGQENTPTKCIAKCIELGYSFAGLRNRTECRCANAAPKRIPVRIRPDAQCSEPCPGDLTKNCGSENRVSVYRTGLSYVSKDDCVNTLSKVNGKSICGGVLVFEDEFDKVNLTKWKQVVRFSGEDGEFVTYTGNNENIYAEDGKLIIKPTLMHEDTVRGTVKLSECTSPNPLDCIKTAKSYDIVPPVKSAQICTKETFTFKYGIVTVRAKMPQGDWIVPEIILKPVNFAYGPGLQSGRIILAQAFGNDDLFTADNINIGSKILKSGLQASTSKLRSMKEKMTEMPSGVAWHNDFQNYSIKWAQDTFEFYLNGNLLNIKCTYSNSGVPVTEEMGFEDDDLKIWKNGTNIAPFDQEFYLCLGVSVGGNTAFPDGSVSNGKKKPWDNYKVKGMLHFWEAKDNWYRTWTENTAMEIDYLSVTSG